MNLASLFTMGMSGRPLQANLLKNSLKIRFKVNPINDVKVTTKYYVDNCAILPRNGANMLCVECRYFFDII